MNNRESFLWWGEARRARDMLVPEHATKAEIKRDEEGYWLNVWWKCGEIAPLTYNEHRQAQGEK